MVIRQIRLEDIPACADILCSVYNNDLWQCRWKQATEFHVIVAFRFVGSIIPLQWSDVQKVLHEFCVKHVKPELRYIAIFPTSECCKQKCNTYQSSVALYQIA